MTDGLCGLLVVDKPAGMSSHGVVGRVRRLAGTRRVGHAGTLDPMATGVLVLGIGRGTRLLTYLVGADKEYLATIRLGAATTTDDAEGEVVATADASHLTGPDVSVAMTPLRGTVDQVPSAVSAIKVDGKRAYARVRDGEQVTLAARRVTITAFDLMAARTEEPFVDVDVHVACSSGTYVRALARDLGAALGVGGHLTSLRRTRVGPFTLQSAHPLDELCAPIDDVLVPLGVAAASFLPDRTLTDDEAARVRHGVAPAPTGTSGAVALRDADGVLIAVAEDAGPRADLRAVFVG
ncbi:MAG: tRNA pseudouridine(55) synthase TruB [Jiangellales bacterium]